MSFFKKTIGQKKKMYNFNLLGADSKVNILPKQEKIEMSSLTIKTFFLEGEGWLGGVIFNF